MNIILFDGVCNFCNAIVNILIKYDTLNQFKFAPQQSRAGERILKDLGYTMETLNSVILVRNNHIFTETDAVIEICKQLKGWPRLFIFLQYVPKRIRTLGYGFIARYRYLIFGKQAVCMVPTEAVKNRFILL